MKKYFLILFILAFIPVQFIASQPSTICLNMIVKNESKVIKRCLGSLKNFINYWVIVDTGSTDGTQEIIKDFMKDVPGDLHQSDWVNFEYNRNEALEFARDKGDYILFIDADEELLFPKDFQWGNLSKDYYFVQTNFKGLKYLRVQLVSSKKKWKWIGVLHEYIDCPEPTTSEVLREVTNFVRPEGCRSQDPHTFLKDAAILEKEVEKDPNNSRNVFYLAQSYFASNQREKALKAYERRSEMKGDTEEVFYSLYRVAVLQEELNMAPEVFLKSYIKAYFHSPHRAEPLNRMALYYRKIKDYKKGYDLTKLAVTIPQPEYAMFIEEYVYSFNLLLENSIDAYYVGNFEESKKICEQLLQRNDLPQELRDGIKKNMQYADSMISLNVRKNLTDLVNSYYDQTVKSAEVKKKADKK